MISRHRVCFGRKWYITAVTLTRRIGSDKLPHLVSKSTLCPISMFSRNDVDVFQSHAKMFEIFARTVAFLVTVFSAVIFALLMFIFRTRQPIPTPRRRVNNRRVLAMENDNPNRVGNAIPPNQVQRPTYCRGCQAVCN